VADSGGQLTEEVVGKGMASPIDHIKNPCETVALPIIRVRHVRVPIGIRIEVSEKLDRRVGATAVPEIPKILEVAAVHG
jgi:hypothetical protein